MSISLPIHKSCQLKVVLLGSHLTAKKLFLSISVEFSYESNKLEENEINCVSLAPEFALALFSTFSMTIKTNIKQKIKTSVNPFTNSNFELQSTMFIV